MCSVRTAFMDPWTGKHTVGPSCIANRNHRQAMRLARKVFAACKLLIMQQADWGQGGGMWGCVIRLSGLRLLMPYSIKVMPLQIRMGG